MIQSSKELEVGQFVKSRAGRDKDRVFIVVGIMDDFFVQIADGDLRKLEKPKIKKVKHLNKLNMISDDVRDKLLNEGKLNNALLRKEVERAGLL
ncbi:KOW domain-containing RNA-binding protein [Fusibacter tunisiensis]|jgi:ribosomal protein L14E/L6E/L27E|uniref:Ribosomal protein L14E/L6E/L27E n=1 Tax=Fusibacter tunisiensis TaxID=1008308 RepID=A0ABS2MQX8_9FIRM|nr:KOW domain-containing RNA-binding protein [Fusibacter tunisiensis]MBM7561818.1 ribosomal protein L14E/L6E/L27E [Fusibacter tunisiensis]